MTTEIETLRAAITDLRIERDALSTKLDAQKLDYELLSDDYRALEANSNALKTRNLQLIAEREVFRTAINELRDELNEVRSTNQKLNETLGGLLTENEALSSEVDELKIRCVELGG